MKQKLINFFRSGTGILLLILIINGILNGRYSNPKEFIYNTLIILPGIIIGLSFHEFGHAFASYKLGDPTPKYQGRVTINPAAHVDPTGLIALIFCGFGWGRPVQIDPRYYKHPRRDELIVSLAGVTMNLLLAVLLSVIIRILINTTGLYGAYVRDETVGTVVMEILLYVVQINLVLMVFNLIPVPPLDGFGVVTQIFNLRNKPIYYKVYQYGMPVLMVLLITGAVSSILSPLVSGMFRLLIKYIMFA